MRHSSLLLLAFFFCLESNFAYGQEFSPELDPGRFEEREISQSTISESDDFQIDIPFIDNVQEYAEENLSDSSIQFKVNKINFIGNTVFSEDKLLSEVLFAVGENITINDLRKATYHITKSYRDLDYIFAKAYLPPQTIKNNTVEIHIAEGRIGDVEFRGDPLSSTSKSFDYANRLKQSIPVRRQDIERMVMFINDLSGLEAKAILAPIEGDPGAMSLILLPERKTYEGAFKLNNYGSGNLGPWQASAQMTVNNITGYDDSLSILHLRTPFSDELSLWSFVQKWFLGNNGLQLQTSFSRSESDPSGSASLLDFEGQSNSYNIELTYPWLRSREENLYLSLGFDSRNSSSEIFDAEVVDDNLRHINAALSYNLFHHRGISDAKLTFSKGLNILDATESGMLTSSRPSGKSDAERFLFSANRYQNLGARYRFIARSKAQIAFDTLLSSDLFGVGGGKFGRAFDYSTITGESGYAVSAELVRNVELPIKPISNAKVSAFVDWGQAYDRTALSDDRWKGIGSAGVSANFKALEHFDVTFDLATPIIRDNTTNIDSDTKALVSFGYRF